MAKRTNPPMPAYGQPMLGFQRFAPGARWARLGLRVIVIAGLAAVVVNLVVQFVH